MVDVSEGFKKAGRRISRDMREAMRDRAGYYKRHATPKAQRERIAVRPVSPMSDVVRLLGHAPRGRTGRGVKVRR